MSARAQDCFATPGERIAVAEALARLEARSLPEVGRETVGLGAAAGRILAEAVLSPRDVPGFDNAAVDGYAFAGSEVIRAEGGRLLLMPGRAAAGHPFTGEVPVGSALRVLTGAVMPAGADTVALQEVVRIDGDTLLVPPGVKPGANRRRAGEDVRAGAMILTPGSRLRPQEIGVAAELGRDRLEVFARPRVAILSSGDELIEPGASPASGSPCSTPIVPILKSLLQSLPVVVEDLGILPDDAEAVRLAMRHAAGQHDVILTSGGASLGDEDHVVRSVAEAGELAFWQIAMKPGRPLAFGRLGRAAFIGLPGNPVATMVCFLLFARPLLLRLAGAGWRPARGVAVPADFAMHKQRGRSEYLRARLATDAAGGHVAVRIEREGSGILTSMVEADGLVELGPEVEQVEARRSRPVSQLRRARHPGVTERYDVCIIGAGIAGASLAWMLAGRRRVLLLERESQPGYHSTGRSAATMHRSYGNAAVRALTAASAPFYLDPPAGFSEVRLSRPRGVLVVAAPGQEGLLAAELAASRRFVPEVEQLEPVQCQGLFPLLRIRKRRRRACTTRP